ncbi:MAG TPA: hypothetical protein VLX28_10625 [Thermoanaerobaculia bacterium]|nr:hypothetical protein [Thermoanaerobaculia bacterium]
MKKFLIIGGSAVVVTIALVVVFKRGEGVRIGPPPKLTPSAVVLMTKLLSALKEAKQDSEHLLSENAELKTTLQEFEAGVPNPIQDVRWITDGLRLENSLVGGDAGLNSNALGILIGINTEILAGEGYDQIDPSLQLLEQSFPQRDASVETLSKQEKILAQLLEDAKAGNDANISSQHLDFLSAIVNVQGMKAEKAIEGLKNIKTTTTALRGVVDDMAAGRVAGSK